MSPTIYGGAESLPAQSREFLHVNPHGEHLQGRPRPTDPTDGRRHRAAGPARRDRRRLLLRQGGCTGCGLQGTCKPCMPLVTLCRKANIVTAVPVEIQLRPGHRAGPGDRARRRRGRPGRVVEVQLPRRRRQSVLTRSRLGDYRRVTPRWSPTGHRGRRHPLSGGPAPRHRRRILLVEIQEPTDFSVLLEYDVSAWPTVTWSSATTWPCSREPPGTRAPSASTASWGFRYSVPERNDESTRSSVSLCSRVAAGHGGDQVV
jgi:hypothetical protein